MNVFWLSIGVGLMVLGFYWNCCGRAAIRRTGQRSFGRPSEVIASRDWQADQQLEEQLSDSPDYTFNTFVMGQRVPTRMAHIARILLLLVPWATL
jgi:hypothetical protein